MRIEGLKRFLQKMARLIYGLSLRFFIATGILFFLVLILCFTSGPFWVFHWLGTSQSGIPSPPQYIVLLGGGGMPSESGLMRTFYAARLSNYYPDAQIIIALPGDINDTTSSVCQMKKELIQRGVAADKILFEPKGRNTRSQAVNIYESIAASHPKVSITIVTAPEHMYRAVLTFCKAGFFNPGGFPAFEQAIEGDITFEDKDLGGRQVMVPSIGKNINLRYRFWTHLRYAELIVKEVFAIGFYWVKGWV
ncbi:MAG: YdcF family protein [Bacteroidales bacterium]|nr:YdcF family protein [Bacteroidales bacterium]MDZ4205183.1 YdcF family protein [Bacteroidales bacterium]